MAFMVVNAMAKCGKWQVSTLTKMCGLVSSHMSTTAVKTPAPPVPEEQVKKSVYISQSRDIFSNLALEEWFYKKYNFSTHHIMLLWRNNPCVVIGRNQNPWIEVNMKSATDNAVDIARRKSGGGTVFHDTGNLNLTFFTPSNRYNRVKNLELISKTLQREWSLNAEINKREDIVIDTAYKISGTASQFGHPNAYHHCTLLVDVNKMVLSNVLKRNDSTPSATMNLSEVHSGVTIERLMERIGWTYLRTTAVTQEDKGWQQASTQNGFQLVNPTEEWFPGLDEIKDEFASWNWNYGQTPKFTAQKGIQLPDGLGDLLVTADVHKGVIQEVTIGLPQGVSWGGLTGDVKIETTVTGQKYNSSTFDILEKTLIRHGLPFIPVEQAASAHL